MNQVRAAFLEAATIARSVIASSEVAVRWDEPSALPQMSVRALAGHLARAGFNVETYLNQPPPEDAPPVSATDYYLGMVASAAWADPSSTLNAQIRQRGEEHAAGGQTPLVVDLDESIQRLHRRLRTEPEDRLVTVIGGVSIRLDDYLVTRIAELTVHIDDLAVSVGLDPPALPSEALDITIALLLDLARRRHGSLAILRALARRERDTENALRVF